MHDPPRGQVLDRDPFVLTGITHRTAGNADLDRAATRHQGHIVSSLDETLHHQIVVRQQGSGLQRTAGDAADRCIGIGQHRAGNPGSVTLGSGDIGGSEGFSSADSAVEHQYGLVAPHLYRHEQAPAARVRTADFHRGVGGGLHL